MSKHTPGPWRIHKGDITGHGDQVVRAEPAGFWVAIATTDRSPDGEIDHEQQTANAHLITAAPDLLSALRRLRNNFDLLLRSAPVRDVTETLAEVDTAIAKAEGQQ